MRGSIRAVRREANRGTHALFPRRRQEKAFRAEGFYERFPAKGEVERVSRVHRELARIAGIEVRPTKAS